MHWIEQILKSRIQIPNITFVERKLLTDVTDFVRQRNEIELKIFSNKRQTIERKECCFITWAPRVANTVVWKLIWDFFVIISFLNWITIETMSALFTRNSRWFILIAYRVAALEYI